MKKMKIIFSVFVFLFVTIILIVKDSYSVDTTITSTNYEVKDNTIYANPTSEKFYVSELLDNINYSGLINVYNANNVELDDNDLIGSGCKIKTSSSTYTIIILGDVTGDGNVNLGDVSKLYNAYKSNITLSDSYLKAGKVTKKSSITLGDVSKLYNFYKGKSPISYFSKDYPDGITNSINKTVDTIANLRTSNLTVGKVAKTNGYSSANDGGGAKYIIESNNNQTIDNGLYIKLDNGNVARLLIGNKTVNVKQFGAKGNGTTDDHEAFNKALNSGAETIKIPDGTYNFNNNIITLTKYTKFVGNGEDETTIKNGAITSEYGVRAEKITFDGGVNQHIDYVGTHSLDEDGRVVFEVTPNGTRDVIYKNCVFKNVKIASHARDNGDMSSDTKIRKSIVTDCKFLNIDKTAIYHDLRMGTGVYTGNTFSEIGSTNYDTGFISGLFLGDITNNTRYEVDDLTIKNNTFENLYTKDNFAADDDQTHVINANFIAVRADKALIDRNTVTNLVGYGHDREGIYTKVRDLTISNNTLTNAGLGEGYICAKAHSGEATFNIINNTFYGTGGTAIRDYGPGTVSGNKIYMTNVYSAIVATQSGTVDIGTNNNYLLIKNNTFKCGTQSSLTVGESTVENYSSGKVAKFSNAHFPITFEDNLFDTTNFSGQISIGNPGNSVTFRNNTFKMTNKSGTAISVVTDDKSVLADSSQCVITAEGNTFEVSDLVEELLRTDFTKTVGVSNRTVTFKNNTISFTGTGDTYAVKSKAVSDNNDKLIIKGNTSNMAKNDLYISTSLKEFEMDNSNFAKVFNNYNSGD